MRLIGGRLKMAALSRLVAEYMAAAPPSAVLEAVETLAGAQLLHMVHSHEGATVACQVLAMATAKQRKLVVKAMKGVCPGKPMRSRTSAKTGSRLLGVTLGAAGISGKAFPLWRYRG
jgi:hypothetical protein